MFTWSRTHTYTLIASLLLVGVFVFLPDVVNAQAPAGGAAGTTVPAGAIESFILKVLWAVVAGVFGFLVWVTGSFLDWSIQTLIVGFGTMFQSAGLGVAVNTLWTIVRDLFNLTFIFGLIFIGFKMILDSNDSGAKKAIGNLIIAALLVNFSLFISKTVIDFSNIAATQIAQVIYRNNSPTGAPISISQVFATQMGLPTIWGQGSAPIGSVLTGTDPNSAPPGGWTYIFGAMFVFVIAAFSFMVGAVLIAIRFITLVFLMIFSPIMFIGKVFSPLEGESKKYMSKLFTASFFAPAFLLLLYFSLYTLGEFTAGFRATGSTSLFAALSSSGTTANGIAQSVNALAGFLMASGFLVGSVIIANKMSFAGSATAMKLLNTTRGKIQSVVGRNTIGRAGKKSDKFLENRGFTSDSTFRGLAKSASEAKFGGSSSFKSVGDARDTRDRFMARKKAVDDVSKSLTTYTTAVGATGGATPDQRIAMERAISGANSEQVIKLLGKHKSGPAREALIASMSSSQFDAVMKAKDEDLNDKDKKDISDLRVNSIKKGLIERQRAEIANDPNRGPVAAAALSDDAALGDGIKKASAAQLKVLGEATLTTPSTTGAAPLAATLTFSQIDDIKKSNDFTETEKERIQQVHKQALIDAFNGAVGLGSVGGFLSKFKDEEVAKLPKSEILKNPASIPHFTGGMLAKIKDSLTPAERAPIKTAIQANQNHPAYGWLQTSQARSF